MFALAATDVEKAHSILDWPLSETLMAYLTYLKRTSEESYKLAMQVWASKTAMGGKTKPPEIPSILK